MKIGKRGANTEESVRRGTCGRQVEKTTVQPERDGERNPFVRV